MYSRGALPGRIVRDRLGGRRPECALEIGDLARYRVELVGVRDAVRQGDRRVRVPHQEVERRGALRFGEQLGSQVRRAERVGLLDDQGAAVLVAAHRHAEAEREQQPDEAEERSLHHAHRLALRVRIGLEAASDDDSGGHCSADDEAEQEEDRWGALPEVHGR